MNRPLALDRSARSSCCFRIALACMRKNSLRPPRSITPRSSADDRGHLEATGTVDPIDLPRGQVEGVGQIVRILAAAPSSQAGELLAQSTRATSTTATSQALRPNQRGAGQRVGCLRERSARTSSSPRVSSHRARASYRALLADANGPFAADQDAHRPRLARQQRETRPCAPPAAHDPVAGVASGQVIASRHVVVSAARPC